MSKALASVLSLSQMDPEKFNTYENFYNHTEQLLDSLNKIYDQRKCHIGLHKIIIKLKEEFDKFPSKSPKVENVQISLLQKKLEKFADNISQQRKRSIQIINKKASKHMAGLNNVFLFGFSQIVLGFLKCGAIKLGVQDKINLYVFEGAGKRRYSITNRPEYNDGVHYTMSLAKNGFKNIHLLPDASFYSLAYDLKCKKQLTRENSLLLFGANGVSSKDKSCGHTSGHMVMAITAKQFGIPLKIVTDSFKFGKIIWNSDLKRYGTEWLAGDLEFINELQQHNIKLINYREDSIPPNFIDEIITEQSKKILPSAGC
jgi:translation initiation factor 2B subunit (eIF-2B alpha/beta/delta family)